MTASAALRSKAGPGRIVGGVPWTKDAMTTVRLKIRARRSVVAGAKWVEVITREGYYVRSSKSSGYNPHSSLLIAGPVRQLDLQVFVGSPRFRPSDCLEADRSLLRRLLRRSPKMPEQRADDAADDVNAATDDAATDDAAAKDAACQAQAWRGKLNPSVFPETN